jgi:arginase
VAHLARSEVEGFFVHLDADSLNDEIMPSVDYRLADGLTWDELITTLRIALASNRVMGMEVAIYNPLLDPDRSAGRGLVNALVAALRR